MPKYWISFRIADVTVGGRTYEDRRDDLARTLAAESNLLWSETTSFVVTDTELSLGTLAKRLKEVIAPSYDLLLVCTLDSPEARIVGGYGDYALFKLIPRVVPD